MHTIYWCARTFKSWISSYQYLHTIYWYCYKCQFQRAFLNHGVTCNKNVTAITMVLHHFNLHYHTINTAFHSSIYSLMNQCISAIHRRCLISTSTVYSMFPKFYFLQYSIKFISSILSTFQNIFNHYHQ